MVKYFKILAILIYSNAFMQAMKPSKRVARGICPGTNFINSSQPIHFNRNKMRMFVSESEKSTNGFGTFDHKRPSLLSEEKQWLGCAHIERISRAQKSETMISLLEQEAYAEIMENEDFLVNLAEILDQQDESYKPLFQILVRDFEKLPICIQLSCLDSLRFVSSIKSKLAAIIIRDMDKIGVELFNKIIFALCKTPDTDDLLISILYHFLLQIESIPTSTFDSLCLVFCSNYWKNKDLPSELDYFLVNKIKILSGEKQQALINFKIQRCLVTASGMNQADISFFKVLRSVGSPITVLLGSEQEKEGEIV